MTTADTAWAHGRFDARGGPRQVLFGRMYEDVAIEQAAFRPGSRVFCIGSAGCTALQLAAQHAVTACDINPVQLDYAIARAAGAPIRRGTAERVMGFARALLPLVGWRTSAVRTFLSLEEPAAQAEFWRTRLDTRRFRAAFDGLLSVVALRAVYASPFLACLPPRLGAVLRGRLARGFARHANRGNPYAAALLLGEAPPAPAPCAAAHSIEFVHGEAAEWLAAAPPRSFDAFTLSNILDGAAGGYRRRLVDAVRHAAAPGAIVVMRSFAEPDPAATTNRAADDRSLLWGIVDVRPATAL